MSKPERTCKMTREEITARGKFANKIKDVFNNDPLAASIKMNAIVEIVAFAIGTGADDFAQLEFNLGTAKKHLEKSKEYYLLRHPEISSKIPS